MEKTASKNESLEQRCSELESLCRLWMAAGQAKDERIAELEAEVRRLRQRVSRLSRLAAQGDGARRRRAKTA